MPKTNNSANRQYYNISHLKDENFLQFPRWLMEDNEFSRLSNDAKILYTLLKDRFKLSAKNGWIDKEGRVFVICKRETMMDQLHKSKPTVIKLMNELEAAELIEDVQKGLNKPNFIYLLMPKLSDKPKQEYEEDNWQYDEGYEYDDNYNAGLSDANDFTSGSKEFLPPAEVKNFDSNKNNSSEVIVNNLSINEDIEREKEYLQFEEYIKKNKPFKYLAFYDFYEIMQKRTNANSCKFALYPLTDNNFIQEKIIKQFLSLMADILSCEDEYYIASRNKKYKTSSFKQRLLLIDENLFTGILCDLQEVENIHSIKPYLTELLYNAPINSSSNALRQGHYDYA